MENPIGDGIDDIFAVMFMSEMTDSREIEAPATSTSTIEKFITATVNVDSGSTTYKPFSDLAALFSSAEPENSSSVALKPRNPQDGSEFTTYTPPTTYTSSSMESTEQPLMTPSTENLTFESQSAEDLGASSTSPKSMTVANAVTAVILFVLASSIALAFATGWAPRMLGLKLPAIRKNTRSASAADQMPVASPEASDPEKLGASPFAEDDALSPEDSIAYRHLYGNTEEEKKAWLQKWNRGKAKLLATLRK